MLNTPSRVRARARITGVFTFLLSQVSQGSSQNTMGQQFMMSL